MTLADIYWWYAQRDWAIAVVLVALIVSLTTVLLFWLSNRR